MAYSRDLSLIREILQREVAFSFVRSSGPGGQNVNKLATTAQLRFDVRASASLTIEVKRRLTRLAGRRLSSEGILTIEARRHRTQMRNRAEALARLRELLEKSLQRSRARTATAPTAASKERRLRSKKDRSAIKRSRRILDDG